MAVPYSRLQKRAWRLRCVLCGEGRPFIGWFRTRHHCARCGYVFMRESGYFLGSIYLNYSLTAFLSIGTFIVIDVVLRAGSLPIYVALCVFATAFPCWFYRYARSLWMAFDVAMDPPRPNEFIIPTPDPS